MRRILRVLFGGLMVLSLGVAACSPATIPATPATPAIPENWKDAIPQEFREEPSLKSIVDFNSLVKSFVHAQKMVGKDKVILPDKHATDQDWAAFFGKIGHPSRLEEYKIDIPKDAGLGDGFLTQLKEVGFKNNILPKQMNEIVKWYSNANKVAVDDLLSKENTRKVGEVEKLKKEWGEAFTKKIKMADEALKLTGLDNVFSWLDEAGLKDDPMMIKIFSVLGEMLMKEDKIAGDEGSSSTPSDIQKSINEILGNKDHPVHSKQHPNHNAAVNELRTLHERLYPTKTV